MSVRKGRLVGSDDDAHAGDGRTGPATCRHRHGGAVLEQPQVRNRQRRRMGVAGGSADVVVLFHGEIGELTPWR
jgi:hypothetical protein